MRELSEYPFYADLIALLQGKGINLNKLVKEEQYILILESILFEEGLNYGNLPKGLLKFHRYENEIRTAFQEHFEEAKDFLSGEKREVNLHFTVSPEHKKLFQDIADQLIDNYYSQEGIRFYASFSEQKASTDTLAVDLENKPFRTTDGDLLFRPGGHGALLENLNDLKESMVFISNIDNVAPDRLKPVRTRYKKVLGGFLLDKVFSLHRYLVAIESQKLEDPLREEIINFVGDISPDDAKLLSQDSEAAFRDRTLKILNRPVRVCGMVKNTGEPGGGPFWIVDRANRSSRQIIESSQINLADARQKKIFDLSTHFNPVDLVCYIHNYQGEKFYLPEFRDPDMGFISGKSFGGRELKALELPGLWNGSMAGWISYFVDVPEVTFSPVKTVFDLIREEHLQ